jgi:hypothetical protein
MLLVMKQYKTLLSSTNTKQQKSLPSKHYHLHSQIHNITSKCVNWQHITGSFKRCISGVTILWCLLCVESAAAAAAAAAGGTAATICR